MIHVLGVTVILILTKLMPFKEFFVTTLIYCPITCGKEKCISILLRGLETISHQISGSR